MSKFQMFQKIAKFPFKEEFCLTKLFFTFCCIANEASCVVVASIPQFHSFNHINIHSFKETPLNKILSCPAQGSVSSGEAWGVGAGSGMIWV